MSGESEITSQASQPKYSRYRSVRAAPAKTETRNRQDADASSSMSRTKSMSRYRRPKLAIQSDIAPPMPSLPHSTSAISNSSSFAAAAPKARRATDPVNPAANLPADYAQSRRPIPKRSQTTEDEQYQGNGKGLQHYSNQQSNYDSNYREEVSVDHKVLTSPSPPAVSLPVQLSDEDTEAILAEQKRKDLERLEATLTAAANDPNKNHPKFGFFRGRRGTSSKADPASPFDNGSSAMRAINDGPPRDGPPRADAPVLPAMGIQQGGGGIVPQIDAPISASNAPERRVLIRCKQSSINLPVDAETTPWDLLNSAANIMTADINPQTAVLLEAYTQLGLERHIRRYEHIRDIMNSWDRDTQNALIVEVVGFPGRDKDLEASSVPSDPPNDFTVQLYHSSKPGKWNKRYITLLSTGQVFISKKSGASLNDKDSTKLCHLSDFDIYSPTAHEIRKNLKPPRRNCYAIKSQQKTSMFISTENFVHFFCSDDERASQQWYSAVQAWRSWYFVHKRGEGQKKATKTMKEVISKGPARSGTRHRVKVSVDENPYTIGSFKPLIDMNRFDRSETEDSATEDEKPKQIPFHLRNVSTVAPLPRREKDRRAPPLSYRPVTAESEFNSGGLLGRTYSERQKAQKEQENSFKAFTDGPSLINPAPTQQGRTMSMRSTKRPETAGNHGNSLIRSPSHKKPKPLLDFTPHFVEPPQWNKAGKGHGVDAPSGVPLVEAANTPSTGLDDIPKANAVFRRETTSVRPRTSGREKEGPFVRGGLVSRG